MEKCTEAETGLLWSFPYRGIQHDVFFFLPSGDTDERAGLGVWGWLLSTAFCGGGVAPNAWCQTGLHRAEFRLQKGKWRGCSEGICPSFSDALQLNVLLGGRHAQSVIALAASERANEKESERASERHETEQHSFHLPLPLTWRTHHSQPSKSPRGRKTQRGLGGWGVGGGVVLGTAN